MFRSRVKLELESQRLRLRLPRQEDFHAWSSLRYESREFLQPWEPAWSHDHLTRRSFSNRIIWSQRAVKAKTAYPFFIFFRESNELVGAITLDNVRFGPAHTGTLGYWIGQGYARQGIMLEAIKLVVYKSYHAFDLSRIEAACLPENVASRKLLEKCGFKYEGVAQSYLQINGRWRTHVLYAALRMDRRGRV